LVQRLSEQLSQAEEKEPANPRVHLLKGIYWLYVPDAYGGGPDVAISSLEKAEALFAKEAVADPMKPVQPLILRFMPENFLYANLKVSKGNTLPFQ
jgi:hypothetical protein